MRKDSAKNDFAKKRTLPMRIVLKGIVSLGVIGIFCGAIFFAYQHKEQSRFYPEVSARVTQVSNWIAERKHHLQLSVVKVKELASTKNNEEQEIHFEFYTTLPNMQVDVSPLASNNMADDNKKIKKTVMEKSVAANKPAVSVDEIEKELESQVNKKH